MVKSESFTSTSDMRSVCNPDLSGSHRGFSMTLNECSRLNTTWIPISTSKGPITRVGPFSVGITWWTECLEYPSTWVGVWGDGVGLLRITFLCGTRFSSFPPTCLLFLWGLLCIWILCLFKSVFFYVYFQVLFCFVFLEILSILCFTVWDNLYGDTIENLFSTGIISFTSIHNHWPSKTQMLLSLFLPKVKQNVKKLRTTTEPSFYYYFSKKTDTQRKSNEYTWLLFFNLNNFFHSN